MRRLSLWAAVSLFSRSRSFTVTTHLGNHCSKLKGSNNEDPRPTRFREDLRELIGSVRHDGDFYATQKVDAALRDLPAVQIDGIGRLAYPIDTSNQVQQIINVASEAPLRVGDDETAVNQGCRKTWQLEADQVKVTGDHGDQWLDTIVSAAVRGLGVHNEQVEANLHKLLLYEEGSYFKTHRDSQKEPGTFATLAIQLPSSFQGGSMTIRHLDVTKKVALEEESHVCLRWTAWYAHCYHENEPLSGGTRVALIYNLVRKPAGTERHPPLTAWDYTKELEMLRRIVQKWQDSLRSESSLSDTKGDDALPEKRRPFFKSKQALDEYRKLNDSRYVHKLDHAYSCSDLGAIGEFGEDTVGVQKYLDRVVEVDSWDGLKGRDRNVAALFCAFGGPLKVRFVVQDVLFMEITGKYSYWEEVHCKTAEIHKQRQQATDDDDGQQETNGPAIAVALDADDACGGVDYFGLYRSNFEAEDAFVHDGELGYRWTDYGFRRVADVESVERFGNEPRDEYQGQNGFIQYRVGYLIVELLVEE